MHKGPIAHASSLDTDRTRVLTSASFYPHHWLLCHMGLYKFEFEFEGSKLACFSVVLIFYIHKESGYVVFGTIALLQICRGIHPPPLGLVVGSSAKHALASQQTEALRGRSDVVIYLTENALFDV